MFDLMEKDLFNDGFMSFLNELDFMPNYKKFENFKSKINGFVFVPEKFGYKLEIKLPKEVTVDDVTVELTDEYYVTVKYAYKAKGCEMSGTLKTNLPEDAISSTLTAENTSHGITLFVKKKPAKRKELDNSNRRIEIQ